MARNNNPQFTVCSAGTKSLSLRPKNENPRRFTRLPLDHDHDADLGMFGNVGGGRFGPEQVEGRRERVSHCGQRAPAL